MVLDNICQMLRPVYDAVFIHALLSISHSGCVIRMLRDCCFLHICFILGS